MLFIPIALLIAVVQMLPLTLVAILGRSIGQIVWWFDWRHRRIALVNLDIAFGAEKSRAERTEIARENFRRLGEAFLCALKTSVMRREEIKSHLQLVGVNKIQPWLDNAEVPGVVVAMGHFANVEMYGEAARSLPWIRPLAVFRRTRSWVLNRMLNGVRSSSPALFFEEQSEMPELRETIRQGNVVLGLMSDYNPGPNGLSVPFFGQPAATVSAPLVHALRFGMPIFGAVCYRTGYGRWRVELSDQIQTHVDGRRRSAFDVLQELNDHFETAVRRDPANWCWVHERWLHEGRKRTEKQLTHHA